MSSTFHRNTLSLNAELILGSNSSLFEAGTAGGGDWQLEFSTLSGVEMDWGCDSRLGTGIIVRGITL